MWCVDVVNMLYFTAFLIWSIVGIIGFMSIDIENISSVHGKIAVIFAGGPVLWVLSVAVLFWLLMKKLENIG